MSDLLLSETDVEALSRVLHAIYQTEARRQAGVGDDEVRHPDDYDALPEHTKEYDRVLARHIIARERILRKALLLACNDCWADSEAAARHYLTMAGDVSPSSLIGPDGRYGPVTDV